MSKKNSNKKTTKKSINLSTQGDALWDMFRQVALIGAGAYFIYQWMFVEAFSSNTAWMLFVGAVLLVSFFLEMYNLNHQIRSQEIEPRQER